VTRFRQIWGAALIGATAWAACAAEPEVSLTLGAEGSPSFLSVQANLGGGTPLLWGLTEGASRPAFSGSAPELVLPGIEVMPFTLSFELRDLGEMNGATDAGPEAARQDFPTGVPARAWLAQRSDASLAWTMAWGGPGTGGLNAQAHDAWGRDDTLVSQRNGLIISRNIQSDWGTYDAARFAGDRVFVTDIRRLVGADAAPHSSAALSAAFAVSNAFNARAPVREWGDTARDDRDRQQPTDQWWIGLRPMGDQDRDSLGAASNDASFPAGEISWSVGFRRVFALER